MPYEIDLTRPPAEECGLIIPDDNLDQIQQVCAASPRPITRDRAVWKKHLLGTGYSKVRLRRFARVKKQVGPSCGSAAITGAYESLVRFSGRDCPTLSIGSVFSFVGGRGGSTLSANIKQLQDVGCVPDSMWPSADIYGRKPAGFDGEAPKWRLRDWEHVPDFDAGTWIILCGSPVVVGVNWGGVGHLIWAGAVYWEPAKGWGWEITNSWGESWGDEGFGVLYESQLANGIRARYGAAAPLVPTY